MLQEGRQMTAWVKILGVMLLAVSMVACQIGPGSDPVKEFRGTEGVEARFGQEAPPRTVYDDQSFFVTLDLHNQGAASVNDTTGPIIAQLNTQNLFYLQQEDGREEAMRQEVTLEGKSDVRPTGEETSVSFGTFEVAPREELGEFQETTELLQARICYPYKTLESDTLCIENSIKDSRTSDPLCRASTKRYPGNGAPVAITKIENILIPVGQVEEVIQREELVFEDGRITGTQTVEEEVDQVVQEPVLKLTIRNKGDGRPVTGDNVCDPSTDGEENTVRVNARLGTTELECTPDLVRLDNGKGTTKCRSTEGLTVNTNYETIFTGELSYTYIESITKDINIRQRPGFNE
jgi:hypothetical protein